MSSWWQNAFFSLMVILWWSMIWEHPKKWEGKALGWWWRGARKQPWFGRSHFLTEAEVWPLWWFWVWGASPDPRWVPGPDACSVLWAPSYAGNTATRRTLMYTSHLLPAHKHMHTANRGRRKKKPPHTHKGKEEKRKYIFICSSFKHICHDWVGNVRC